MNLRPITEDDLHAYVDQALDAVRQAEVAKYLTSHPDVAKRVEGYQKQHEALRAALAPIAEEPVPPELNLGRMIEKRRWQRSSWRAVAASLLLLCVGGAGGWLLHDLGRPASEGIAALAQEAADSYDVYAPDRIRPVELRATEEPEMVRWFAQRLGRPVTVPDLSGSGYRFMGGRLVPTPHGPAVLFMYDDDLGTRLVLLTRPMAADRNISMSQQSRGSVTGWTWAKDGIGYSLVGPTSPEILHPLADEVRKQIGREV